MTNSSWEKSVLISVKPYWNMWNMVRMVEGNMARMVEGGIQLSSNLNQEILSEFKNWSFGYGFYKLNWIWTIYFDFEFFFLIQIWKS